MRLLLPCSVTVRGVSKPVASYPVKDDNTLQRDLKIIPPATRCTVARDADPDLLPVRTFTHAPRPVHDAFASVLSRDRRLLRSRHRSVGVRRQVGIRRSLARRTL